VPGLLSAPVGGLEGTLTPTSARGSSIICYNSGIYEVKIEIAFKIYFVLIFSTSNIMSFALGVCTNYGCTDYKLFNLADTEEDALSIFPSYSYNSF
jgi:hypothetical protein